MRLKDVMNPVVHTIDAGESAQSAWETLQRTRARCLIVMQGGEAVGIVAERDLRSPHGMRLQLDGGSVREAMRPGVVGASPTATLAQALSLLPRCAYGFLPVLDHGAPIGAVTLRELLPIC